MFVDRFLTVGSRQRFLLLAAYSLRGSHAPFPPKEEKEDEQASNRESREKISEEVQHVMNC
jgi:hypothetical protein